jgi:archaellum component FlaF (FlaF/FlaG flagellin family)
MFGLRRIIGLAFLAMGVASAIIPSMASAQAFNFKAEKVPTRITGVNHAGTDIFTFDAGKAECNKVTYVGEQMVTPTSTLSFTPTYSGCTIFGFANSPVVVNGCSYKFTTVTKEIATFEGAIDIVCPAGKVIEFQAFGCTVTVGSQTSLKRVTFTNVGTTTTSELTYDVSLTGIKYEEHNKGMFPTCAFNTKPTTNGTFGGAFLTTGENPLTGAHQGISVE